MHRVIAITVWLALRVSYVGAASVGKIDYRWKRTIGEGGWCICHRCNSSNRLFRIFFSFSLLFQGRKFTKSENVSHIDTAVLLLEQAVMKLSDSWKSATTHLIRLVYPTEETSLWSIKLNYLWWSCFVFLPVLHVYDNYVYLSGLNGSWNVGWPPTRH